MTFSFSFWVYKSLANHWSRPITSLISRCRILAHQSCAKWGIKISKKLKGISEDKVKKKGGWFQICVHLPVRSKSRRSRWLHWSFLQALGFMKLWVDSHWNPSNRVRRITLPLCGYSSLILLSFTLCCGPPIKGVSRGVCMRRVCPEQLLVNDEQLVSLYKQEAKNILDTFAVVLHWWHRLELNEVTGGPDVCVFFPVGSACTPTRQDTAITMF